MNFLSSQGLKLVFICKIMVITYILISQTNLFTLGEKDISAQEDVSLDPSSESDYVDDNEPVDETKKSFIEELLKLPKISSEDYKKTELAKYFSIIERKSRQVEDRIKVLEVRQKQLTSLENSIDDKLEKLDNEMMFFKQTVQNEKKIQEDRLKHLVKFYEKMSPKKAAPVFEKMDKDLVVSLFKEIPDKQTMQILSLMNPDRSIELTEYYGRIKSAKEYELLTEINSALRKEFEVCKTEPTPNR
ncbi:MAG: hypothetical protein HRU19_00460 [Pseudobacteriovorax sp.]|nr:hypothetical protein [Pseudobacteriovorax sp.]